MAKRLAAALSVKYQASAWAHRFSADIWSERQSWNDAALEYRRALAIDSRQPGLHTQLGRAYLAQLKANDAEAEFQEELKLDPLDEKALLGMAETQLAKGSPAAALEVLSRIWDADPSFLTELSDFPAVNLTPEVAARLAEALAEPPANRGDTTQLTRDLSANGPTTAAFHFLKSALLRAAGDAASAQAEHDAFMRQFQDWQATQAQKPAGQPTWEACQQHRYRACAQWLQARNPQTFGDRLLLGKTLLAMHENERASDAFATAVGQEPTNPTAIYWLLRTYRRLADSCFARLAETFPDSWRIHQMKAEIYISAEQDKPAIEEYQLALEKNPEDPALHEALGGVYLKKKSLPEARVELEKALQLDPTAAGTLYLVGQLCVAERKPAEGIPYLQNALRRDPSLLEARATLGKAYVQVGKPQLAVPELEKSLALDHYGDLHFQLSQAYRQLGKPALAQQALARSQALRKASAAADQEKLARARDDDN